MSGKIRRDSCNIDLSAGSMRALESWVEPGRAKVKSKLSSLIRNDGNRPSTVVLSASWLLISNAPGPREIEFKVPAEFEIATPWEKAVSRAGRDRGGR